MIDVINQETLTQTEKAKEQKITVRWVKEKTRNGKLKPYYPKATVLYDKDINET